MATPVQMPKQGNSVTECLLTEWRVKEGDRVKSGDILCGIETDKATFEVEAPTDGVVIKLFRDQGDLVPVLTNIAAIGEAGESVDDLVPVDEDKAEETAAPQAIQSQTRVPVVTSAGSSKRTSPRARKLADKLGVDPAMVVGSGPNGRVISHDIKAASGSGLRLTPNALRLAAATGKTAGIGTGVGGRVRARDLIMPASGSPAFSTAGEPATEVPYRGIRKLIGDRMLSSLYAHAQLTLNSSADACGMLALRKRIKASDGEMANLSLNDMICFVVARVLPDFPELNALFDIENEKVLHYKHVHLALAVDTERGLMVPVIRNAQALTASELRQQILDLAGDCRSGSINPDLLQGGTFTITNLGALGIESFTPVLNSPQVGILGICAITNTPVAEGDKIRLQPRLGLSLTIDHQVVDGAPAARFLQAVAESIQNIEDII